LRLKSRLKGKRVRKPIDRLSMLLNLLWKELKRKEKIDKEDLRLRLKLKESQMKKLSDMQKLLLNLWPGVFRSNKL
jgi:hypothetical protein